MFNLKLRDMLHKKDVLLGFYEPKKAVRGKGSDFEVVVTMQDVKTEERSIAYRLDFTKKFILRFGYIERLSVRFDRGSVVFVFDVPTNMGVPFYKMPNSKAREDKRMTLSNSDLVRQIFKEKNKEDQFKLFCDLGRTARVGNVDFYELIVKDTQM